MSNVELAETKNVPAGLEVEHAFEFTHDPKLLDPFQDSNSCLRFENKSALGTKGVRQGAKETR
jgi:hypothetical protein